MLEEAARQQERSQEESQREAERQARKADYEARRAQKEQEKQIAADQARSVREAAAAGAKIETDVATGKRTVATHSDGAVKFETGPVGDPVVQQTEEAAMSSIPGMGGFMSLTRPPDQQSLGQTQEVVQTYRDDRGNTITQPLPTKTDPKTGVITSTVQDPVTGRPTDVPLGTDQAIQAKAAKDAELEQRRQEIALRKNRVDQDKMRFTPQWEPVKREFDEANKELNAFTDPEKIKFIRDPKTGKMAKRDPNTGLPSWEYVDPNELAKWSKDKAELEARQARAKVAHDKLAPFAENLNRNETEIEAARLKYVEEKIRHDSGIKEDAPLSSFTTEGKAKALEELSTAKPTTVKLKQQDGSEADVPMLPLKTQDGQSIHIPMVDEAGKKLTKEQALDQYDKKGTHVKLETDQDDSDTVSPFTRKLANMDIEAARVRSAMSTGKVNPVAGEKRFQLLAELKNQTIEQAKAEATARLEAQGREIASKFIGTGVKSQQLAGAKSGGYAEFKNELNEMGAWITGNENIREKTAQRFRLSGHNLDRAITMAEGDTKKSLTAMKEQFDKAGINPEERARIIKDAAMAQAWTEKDADNLRQLSTGDLVINPGRVFGQKDALIAEINASDTNPAAKKDAIARLDAMRKAMAETLENDTYYADSGFAEFVQAKAEKGESDKVAMLDEWMAQQKNRNGIFKAVDAVKVGLQTGTIGIAKTAVGGAAGISALVGADGMAGSLGENAQFLGEASNQIGAAGKTRGLTGGYGITTDLTNTVTQMAPMLVGGWAAGGLKGASQVATRGASVYGWAAAQGYESKLSDALDMAAAKKGSALTSDEIAGVLGQTDTQVAGFLNAAQTVILAAAFPKGAEAGALGKVSASMTVSDFLRRGGMRAVKDGTLRQEIKTIGKNIFADGKDEALEEFSNQVLDGMISVAALDKELQLGTLLEDSFKALALGGGVGGAMPQVYAGQTKQQQHEQLAATLQNQMLGQPDRSMVSTALATLDPQTKAPTEAEIKQARQIVQPSVAALKEIEERRTAYEAAIKAKDYKGAAAIDQEINDKFTQAQTDAALDAADAVLLTRELAGIEEQAKEAVGQANAALYQAKATGDKQGIAAAEANLEQVTKDAPNVPLARAAVKLATGQDMSALTDSELRAVGYKPGESGAPVQMTTSELKAQGLAKPLVRMDTADGSAVILDEAIDQVIQTSTLAALRIQLGEQAAMEAAQARYDSAQQATTPPTNEQDTQGQQGTPTQNPQPAPADENAPVSGGGSGAAAPVSGGTGAAQAQAPVNLAEMEAGEYEAARSIDPTMPDASTPTKAEAAPPAQPEPQSAAQSAIDRAKARFPGLTGGFQIVEGGDGTTGGAQASGATITILTGDLERELSGYAPEKQDSRVDAVIDEEVIHLAQFEAARRSGESVEDFYGALWGEFTPAQRKAAASTYQATFDKQEDWQKAAETVRILIQQRADGRVTELTKAFNKNIPARLVEILKAAVEFLKSSIENGEISQRVQDAITGIEAILAEYSGTDTTTDTKPQEKPANQATAEKNSDTNEDIPTDKESLTVDPLQDLRDATETIRQGMLAARKAYPQLVDSDLGFDLEDIAYDMAEALATVPADQRKGMVDAAIAAWLEDNIAEKPAKATGTADQKARRKAWRQAAQDKLNAAARQILNSGIHEAFSAVFDKGRITPMPNILGLIRKRRADGKTLTQREIDIWQNESEWNGALKKSNYTGGGQNPLARAMIDLIMARQGEGQSPNTMADALKRVGTGKLKDMDSASDMWEQLAKELRAVTSGKSEDKAGYNPMDDPNYEPTDAEIAEWEANQAATAQDQDQQPYVTLGDAYGYAIEAFGPDAPITQKIGTISEHADRFYRDDMPSVRAVISAEFARHASGQAIVEAPKPEFEGPAAGFYRFFITTPAEKMREMLASLPVADVDSALFSSPSPGNIRLDLISSFSKAPASYTYETSNERRESILSIARKHGLRLVNPADQGTAIRRFQEVYGVTVTFYEGGSPKNTGFVSGNNIFVNSERNDIPTSWTLTHELIHVGQKDLTAGTPEISGLIGSLLSDTELKAVEDRLLSEGYKRHELATEIPAFLIADAVTDGEVFGFDSFARGAELKASLVDWFDSLQSLNPELLKTATDDELTRLNSSPTQPGFSFDQTTDAGDKGQKGFNFDAPAATPPTTVNSPGRFKPKTLVEFKRPITGPSGAKLAAYEWKYRVEDMVDKRGEDAAVRVSNWEESQTNDATGREVVHQFYVETPDGKSQLVSLESALKILGYTPQSSQGSSRVKSLASVVKTRARNQMDADRVQAEIDKITAALAEVRALELPEVVKTDGPEVTRGMVRSATPVYVMGDATSFPDWKFEGPKPAELAAKWRANRMKERGFPADAKRQTVELAAINKRIAKADAKIDQITGQGTAEAPSAIDTLPPGPNAKFVENTQKAYDHATTDKARENIAKDSAAREGMKNRGKVQNVPQAMMDFGMSGSFGTKDQPGLFSSPTVAPFYSQLARTIEEKMPKQAPIGQVVSIAQSGPKAEEVKWSGLIPWLQSVAVDGKVSKDAVLKYLANEGMVRFEEVVQGDGPKSERFEIRPSGSQYVVWDVDGEQEASPEGDLRSTQRELEELQRLVAPTKFAQYTLPGGENYREIVLAMPEKREALEKSYTVYTINGTASIKESYATREEADTRAESINRGKDIDADDRAYVYKERPVRVTGENYTSSHFPDVPNYIAHMRTNERTDFAGKPGLFIEELQSDRHQAGRKKGYREDANTTILYGVTIDGNWYAGFNDRRTAESRRDMLQGQFPSAKIEITEQKDPDPQPAEGIPDAPFRKEWPLALFKRALRDAVASGKDWIGWTVGETQNDRFDLSKQVDSVSVTEWPAAGQGMVILTATKDGSELIKETIPKSKIEDYVGKDVARKLMDQPAEMGSRELSGDGLKVGGSGMKGFYDNMLPKEIGKYVKQWGGNVEKGDLSLDESEKFYVEEGAPGTFWLMDTSTNMEARTINAGPYESRQKALDAIKAKSSSQTPIWRIDITPAMKAGVSAGQALFSSPSNQRSLDFGFSGSLGTRDQEGFDFSAKPVTGPAKMPRRLPDTAFTRTIDRMGPDRGELRKFDKEAYEAKYDRISKEEQAKDAANDAKIDAWLATIPENKPISFEVGNPAEDFSGFNVVTKNASDPARPWRATWWRRYPRPEWTDAQEEEYEALFKKTRTGMMGVSDEEYRAVHARLNELADIQRLPGKTRMIPTGHQEFKTRREALDDAVSMTEGNPEPIIGALFSSPTRGQGSFDFGTTGSFNTRNQPGFDFGTPQQPTPQETAKPAESPQAETPSQSTRPRSAVQNLWDWASDASASIDPRAPQGNLFDTTPKTTDTQSNDIPSSTNLEPDRQQSNTGNGGRQGGVSTRRGSTGQAGRSLDEGGNRSGNSGQGGAMPAGVPSATDGITGDPSVSPTEPAAQGGDSRDSGRSGRRGPDDGGLSPQRPGANEPRINLVLTPESTGPLAPSSPRSTQSSVTGEWESPLTPEQQGDVEFIDARLNQNGHPGVLLTNGTGTGKTFSGLGAVKQALDRGAKHILVVAPSDKVGSDWKNTAQEFFNIQDAAQLVDTKDNGGTNRLVMTTYANLGQNANLVNRPWDLIVADEAHYLSQNKEGKDTNALDTFRALTFHKNGIFRRAEMLEPEAAEISKQIRKLPFRERMSPIRTAQMEQADRALSAARERVKSQMPAREARPKAILLSATPFAWHFSLDYAEGYLFDHGPEPTSRAYNTPSARDAFYITNFGYRMRTGKLTQPDAAAATATGILERRFAEKLMKEKAMSGRALQVEQDYSRQFILSETKLGEQIDAIIKAIRENPRFTVLSDYIGLGDYLARRYLLEGMKARESVDRIRKHLAMGRKVVVFHDYKKGGAVNPLRAVFHKGDVIEQRNQETGEMETINLPMRLAELKRAIPGYAATERELDGLLSPIDRIEREFPQARIFNGSVPKGQRRAIVDEFNRSGSPVSVILVQRASGKEGISLHDRDAKHQRVFIDIGLANRPTDAIQGEGRIYRHGVRSNAIVEYLSTGTDFERQTFAETIAKRSSTAENLAMGERARSLLQSFANGYNEAEAIDPNDNQGTGGKEMDRQIEEGSSYKTAVALFYTNQKKTSRNKSSEGTDYFATPEPLGFKMVEWADIQPGEKVLEPSAGHGAIARFFPDSTNRHGIEPSSELASRLALNATDITIHRQRFEDYNVMNKFNAVVMNPPFGTAGKTAMDHLIKALGHLRNGGRVVALIPEGSSMEKRFDKWYESEEAKNYYVRAKIKLPTSTFERAGTGVSTRVVIIDKMVARKGDEQKNLENTRIDLTRHETLQEFINELEFITVPPRPEVASVAAEEAEAEQAPAPNLITGGRDFILPASIPRPEAETTFSTAEFNHSKTGAPLFVAKIERRLSKEEYARVAASAKAFGGYYSSYNKEGAIPGFHFKSAEARDVFIGGASGESPLGSSPTLYSSPVDKSSVAAYLSSNGTPSSVVNEESERVSAALAQSGPDRLAEDGSAYSQGDFFAPEQSAAPSQGEQIAMAGARAVTRAKAQTGRDAVSADLIAGLQGDWKALAREVDNKGRASAILADLINREIPVWNVNGTILDTPEAVHAVMLPIRSPYFESLKVMVLDGNMKAVHSQILTVGALNESTAQPAEVLGVLARLREIHGKKYTSIIFSHNHPSGDPSPSRADESVTRRLNQIADIAGWNVMDHIITNGETYYSFRESGYLGNNQVAERPYTPRKKDGAVVPRIQKADRQAPWEAVKMTSLRDFDRPERVTEVAKHLRNGNPDAAHIFYVNTRMKLMAIERVDLQTLLDQRKLTQALLAGRGREGAYGFILDYPIEKTTATILSRRATEVAILLQMQFIDAVTIDPQGIMQSARESGLLAEEPAQLRSSPTQPDLFAAATAPDATQKLGTVKVGTMNALVAYRTLTAKRNAGKTLTADEEQKLLDAETALGQKLAFDMDAVKGGPNPTKDEVFATRIATAKREIDDDIDAGRIPDTVTSFAELQDYVDANEYVNDADRPDRMIGPLGNRLGWKPQDYTDFTNQIIDEIDKWLADGRKSPPTKPAAVFGQNRQAGQDEMSRAGEIDRSGQISLLSSPAPDNSTPETIDWKKFPPVFKLVYAAILEGQSVAQIAKKLRITEKAVTNISTQLSTRVQALDEAADGKLAPKMNDGLIERGRPERAMSVSSPEVARILQIRQDNGDPEVIANAETYANAKRMIAADYQGTIERITNRRANGEDLTLDEVAAAQMILLGKVGKKRSQMTSEEKVQLGWLAMDWVEQGTEDARRLQIRRDVTHSPAERAALYFAKELYTPQDKATVEALKKAKGRKAKEEVMKRFMERSEGLKSRLKERGIDLEASLEEFRRQQDEKQAMEEAVKQAHDRLTNGYQDEVSSLQDQLAKANEATAAAQAMGLASKEQIAKMEADAAAMAEKLKKARADLSKARMLEPGLVLRTALLNLTDAQKAAMETLLNGGTIENALAVGGMTQEALKKLYTNFGSVLKKARLEAQALAKQRMLEMPPVLMSSSMESDELRMVGYVPWGELEERKAPITPEQVKVKPKKQPKAKPAEPVTLTPEQQEAIDAAFERFKNADPATWTTLFETESKTLAPLIGQVGFEEFKGRLLQPWKDRWQTEMDGIANPAARITFEEWIAKPSTKETANRERDLFPQPINETTGTFDTTAPNREGSLFPAPINETTGTWNDTRPYTSQGELIREEISTTTGLLDFNDPLSVRNALREISTGRSSTMDRVMEWWRASILSGPQTAAVNTASNLSFGAFNAVPRRAVEASVNSLLKLAGMGSTEAATFGEFASMAQHLRGAARLAGTKMLQSWREESANFKAYALATENQLNFGGKDWEQFEPALPGKVGTFMRSISFRHMQAADEFMKFFFGQLEAAAQAYRIAQAEGLKGAAREARITQLIETRGSEAWIKTYDIMQRNTFQEKMVALGEGTGAIRIFDSIAMKAKNARRMPYLGRPITFFLPFIDTPTNVTKQAVEISPLGGMLALIDGSRALKRRLSAGTLNADGMRISKEEAKLAAAELYDKERFVKDMTNQVIAWGLYFAISAMVEGDDDELPLITGTMAYTITQRGERDVAERVMPPQSIRIPGTNTFMSYSRMDPFATIMAGMVDMTRSLNREGGMNSKVATDFLVHTKNAIKDKTFLQGVSNLINALEDPSRVMERLSAGILTGFVPNLIRQPIREADMMKRDVNPRESDGLAMSVAKRIGYSIVPASAPLKIDVWGRELPANHGEMIGGHPVANAIFRTLDPTNLTVGAKIDPLDLYIFTWNNEAQDTDKISITPIEDFVTGTVNGKSTKFPLTVAEQTEANRRVGRQAYEFLIAQGLDHRATSKQGAELITDAFRSMQRTERERIRNEKLAAMPPVK